MINLRQARMDDHWRVAFKRNYPLSLKTMEFHEGNVFGNIKLSLQPGINAIVGKNGIGKSNFIRAIYNSLMSDLSNRKKFSQLLDKSKIKLDLSLDNRDILLNLNSLDVNIVDGSLLCLLFDPCTLIPEIQNLFNQQENLDELIESYNTITLSPDDLKIANFITNTEYTNIEVINIEDEYDSFPMLPYFRVYRNGVNYDSRCMGLGELSLLYYFWIIDYIKKSEKHCLLIIEEPESFLPPLIQKRLCDVLAMTLSTKGTTCLLTTHSEHILKKIPNSHIHIMCSVMNKIMFFNASMHSDKMDLLGLTPQQKGFIFYEDSAALIFTKALIKSSSSFSLDCFIYYCSGSDGDVLKDLQRFPTSIPNFKFIAIFDGDCRVRMRRELEKNENYIFLPSNLSPEEHIISYLKTVEINTIASFINKTTESIAIAFEIAAGLDHHDYFLEIARNLNISYEDLFTKLCELWIGDPKNAKEIDSFTMTLEKLTN